MRTIRSLTAVLASLILTCAVHAQEASAIVRFYDGKFSMGSSKTGTFKVVTEIEVLGESGAPASVFVENTDSYISLSSFSGSVSYKGKVLTKITKSDLSVRSLSSGLAEDNLAYYYSPSAPYPYTVKYEYTMSYRKGVAFFPTFMPVSDEKVSIENATYSIEVLKGTEIQYYASKASPSSETKGGTDTYIWKVSDFKGFVSEHQMPSALEMVPFVFAAPKDFMYGGTTGSQRTWNDVGKWLNSLQTSSDDLPEDFKATLKEMTRDCRTTFDKVSVLYKFLREKTRYVSIQYGIGGYVPFPASTVLSTGFGDCKALSNFLRSALAAVDVPSDYFILNTERKESLPGIVTFGLMNHVMLSVPLPERNDTLWVECTNPVYPLGYRHSGVAGHEVVLIGEGGGQVITVPSYPDSLSRQSQKTVVTLDDKGGASISGHRDMYLDRAEPYIGFGELSTDAQIRRLTSAMKIHPDNVTVTGIGNNFGEYVEKGKDFCPHIWLDYTMSTTVYANADGSRIFLPFNPVAQGMTFQRGTRVNDLVITGGMSNEDVVEVKIPAGYKVESIPEPVELHTVWGDFVASASQKGSDTVLTKVSYTFRPARIPKENYDQFRSFARAVNRAFESKIVLARE